MDKYLLAAVLTITSIAPALARTNHVRHSPRSIAALAINAVAYPRSNTVRCSPYIGGWQEGYPGTASC
jgi:hypothetical protein